MWGLDGYVYEFLVGFDDFVVYFDYELEGDIGFLYCDY